MRKEEFMARVRHLIWCGYQMGCDQPFNWEITKEQLDSLIDGVMFQEMNPNATPEMNHENWMRKKQEQGWKYGPVKDFEKKEHPDMVPYDELPVVKMQKDDLDLESHQQAKTLWWRLHKGKGWR